MTIDPHDPAMRRWRPPAQAVIFDMDGLLVNTEPYWGAVETAVFAEFGFDIGPYIGRGHTKGMRVDEAVRYFCSCLDAGHDLVDEIVLLVVARIVAAVWEEVELLPGARSAVQYCHDQGLSLALASGSVPPVIEAVLDRFELRREFAVVTSASGEVYGKPHPSIFLRTAKLLDVEPIRCMVVEDAINGCIAACAALMGVVAVPDVKSAKDPRFSIADVVLPSLEAFSSEPVASLLGIEQVRSR